ncbi:unnamed protein product [Hymenolepis diminuta]|uniref:N2227 domain-containing protein n=1 Tax=Hymenolepis diminuta TaxID=6216 RepID=A0A158QCS8_HYMDI|nr:unnamed protein product [Hymenolepis diminuta]VUZ44485.1 unnamed protein product [Hymenolepis diminuta]
MSSGVDSIVPNTTDQELEAWWEKFIAEKRRDDAQDEDIRQQWDNFATRKLKFIREFRILTDLYEPTEKVVNSILSNDYAHRGQKLYSEWCKVGKKECLLAYYDTPVFRAIYTYYRFLSSATSFLQALVERLIPEHPDLETYLLQNVRRVISVGVGPGSDIAAFLAYIRCRGVTNRLVYYAIDQSEGWSTFLSAFDRHWSMVHNFSIWFKPWRFGKRDDVACLPDADMMVFSFSNTTLMDKAIWPLLIQRYKFILVLDGMKDRVVTNLGAAGFSDFRLSEKTTIYYYFAGLQEPQTDTLTEAAGEGVSTEPKE